MLAAGVQAQPETGRWLTTAVAGTLVLALTLLVWARPAAYNWDMLAYAAIALKEGDPGLRHSTLWEYVDRDVPRHQQALLRGDIAEQFGASLPKRFASAGTKPTTDRVADTLQYRKVTATDPQAFAEQLPFYAVKPLYPALIALTMKLTAVVGGGEGIGPVQASVVVAKLAWVCFGVALFLLLRLRLPNGLAALSTVSAMALPMVHALGSYSSPDTLSAAFILLGFVLALRDPSRLWTLAAAGVLLLAIAARPDNLVLLGLLLCWFLWNRRLRLRSALAVGGIGLAWCLGLAHLSNNYGWAVLVHHSFIDFVEYPSQLKPQLTAGLLVELYVSKLRGSLVFFGLMAFGALVALARWQRRGSRDLLLQALVVMLAFMAAHWLIFPDQKDRLMVAPYLFILASATFVLADRWADIARRGQHAHIDS